MKTIKLLATGIIVFSAVTLMPAMADEMGKVCDVKHHAHKWGSRDGDSTREFSHLGRGLNLTDVQKETLKGQRDTSSMSRQARKRKLVAAHEALKTAAFGGANDVELAALADNLGKLQTEQALVSAKMQQAFLAVLTVEQKQKMAAIKAKHNERRDKRRYEKAS